MTEDAKKTDNRVLAVKGCLIRVHVDINSLPPFGSDHQIFIESQFLMPVMSVIGRRRSLRGRSLRSLRSWDGSWGRSRVWWLVSCCGSPRWRRWRQARCLIESFSGGLSHSIWRARPFDTLRASCSGHPRSRLSFNFSFVHLLPKPSCHSIIFRRRRLVPLQGSPTTLYGRARPFNNEASWWSRRWSVMWSVQCEKGRMREIYTYIVPRQECVCLFVCGATSSLCIVRPLRFPFLVFFHHLHLFIKV